MLAVVAASRPFFVFEFLFRPFGNQPSDLLYLSFQPLDPILTEPLCFDLLCIEHIQMYGALGLHRCAESVNERQPSVNARTGIPGILLFR